jgi:Coenzyme PQQ synthesis protein D (PqqD)
MSTGPHDISDAARVVLSRDQVSCGLGDEAAIVNLKNGVYYGLDPVGARIWSVMREPVTVAQIRDALLGEYDIEPLALERDIRSFLQQLAEQGLIEIAA